MNKLDLLEKLAASIPKDVKETGNLPIPQTSNATLYAKIMNFLSLSLEALPNHSTFIQLLRRQWMPTSDQWGIIDPDEAVEAIDYVLELIMIEKTAEEKISEGKVFDSANDKI